MMSFLVELDSPSPEDYDTPNMIALASEIIDMKLAVATSDKPDEMAYDEYLKQFQRITKLAQSLTGSGSSDVPMSLSVYKTYILPALLWSGAKCRDRLVHRDICSLLNLWSGNDYWISATAVALRRLIDLESHGVNQEDKIPEISRVTLLDVKIRSRESQVELRYHRPKDILHPKKNCNEWESESMFY
jgi:hypothetical protein